MLAYIQVEVFVAFVPPLLVPTVCSKYSLFTFFGETIFEVAVLPMLSNLRKYDLAPGFWVMICGMLLRALWNQPKLLCNWDGSALTEAAQQTEQWVPASQKLSLIWFRTKQISFVFFFFLEIWQTRPSVNLLSIHYYICSIYPVL